jgi:hypothetical protein
VIPFYEPMRPEDPPNTEEGRADWLLADFDAELDTQWVDLWHRVFAIRETYWWRRQFRLAER